MGKCDHYSLCKVANFSPPAESLGWTEEVFVVSQAMSGVVPTYKIQEWDGTSVEGTFYHQDLQKVTVKDDDLFRVEKIVKRKGDKVLVRWKSWPDKYDSWIEKRALTST